MLTIGLLYEQKADLMVTSGASDETHYHWREPEEVEAVATQLQAMGYLVDRIGPLDRLMERWSQDQFPDLVWNLSVRAQSRNRTALAPALLEQFGIPYTGGDATTKCLALNKDWLKTVLQWRGITTPPWLRYGVDEVVTTLPPWPTSILKPVCEGYSLGLVRWNIQQGLTDLQAKVADLQQQFQSAVLCEKFIAGREITIGIVGNTHPLLIGAVETVTLNQEPLLNQVLDLTVKRQGGLKKIGVDLSVPAFQPLRQAALDLMRQLGPLDYATFDFRVTPCQAYLLDVNADATLHPKRSLARVAEMAGFSYGQLIKAILQTSLERWQLL